MPLAASSGLNDSSTSGMVSPAIARSSTVTTSSITRRPFGKPAIVPGDHAERIRVGDRRDGHVKPNQVRLGLARCSSGSWAPHPRGCHHVGRTVVVPGQILDRNLDRDAVHVQSLRTVDADGGGRRDQVRHLEPPQHAEVEDAAEIDVETLGALTREHQPVTRQVVDRLCGEVLRVVRRASGADIDLVAGSGCGPAPGDPSPCSNRRTEWYCGRFQVVSVALVIGPVL